MFARHQFPLLSTWGDQPSLHTSGVMTGKNEVIFFLLNLVIEK